MKDAIKMKVFQRSYYEKNTDNIRERVKKNTLIEQEFLLKAPHINYRLPGVQSTRKKYGSNSLEKHLNTLQKTCMGRGMMQRKVLRRHCSREAEGVECQMTK